LNTFLDKGDLMITIKNKSKISTDKIEKIIELLPDEYKNDFIDIRVYDSVWEVLKVIFSNNFSITPLDFISIFRLKIVGAYSGEKANIIEMYLFNIPKEYREMYFILNLFHEFRHFYQKKYNDEFYESNRFIPTTDADLNKYINNNLELDAEEFAYNFYTENQNTINEIMGFEDNYELKKKF
jgi:hypothetical protein